MFNIRELLEEIKASPYRIIEIVAPHTGFVKYAQLVAGDSVYGASGEFREKNGTPLVTITRENNDKTLYASENGEVLEVMPLDQSFVEAGQVLMTVRHYLSCEEVIERILQKTLHLFVAPEQAKYYFIPELDTKLKLSGKRSVKVRSGMEILIASRMKRETPLMYDGPEGIIYSVYFHRGETVEAGQALVGICPEKQLSVVQEVVARVHSEWVDEVHG